MTPVPCGTVVLRGISTSFDALSPSSRQVSHALLTRPPLEYFGASSSISPLDLHVLGTPPAFVLSQDQTLVFDSVLNPEVITSSSKLMYELTVFVLTVTRENHSLAFVFFILYRFQGSCRPLKCSCEGPCSRRLDVLYTRVR